MKDSSVTGLIPKFWTEVTISLSQNGDLFNSEVKVFVFLTEIERLNKDYHVSPSTLRPLCYSGLITYLPTVIRPFLVSTRSFDENRKRRSCKKQLSNLLLHFQYEQFRRQLCFNPPYRLQDLSSQSKMNSVDILDRRFLRLYLDPTKSSSLCRPRSLH